MTHSLCTNVMKLLSFLRSAMTNATWLAHLTLRIYIYPCHIANYYCVEDCIENYGSVAFHNSF